MAAFTIFCRPRDVTDPDDVAERVPWRRWTATGVLAYALIVAAASYVNSEHTMGSANTRFPIWSWKDGR